MTTKVHDYYHQTTAENSENVILAYVDSYGDFCKTLEEVDTMPGLIIGRIFIEGGRLLGDTDIQRYIRKVVKKALIKWGYKLDEDGGIE